MSSATLAAAFGAGVLSFATPCVLPLVPAYLAAVGGGATVDDLRERRGLGQTLRGVAPFILGFGAVFVFFGALVGAAGSALDDWRAQVAQAAGIIVVAMGLALAGVLPAAVRCRDSQAVARGRRRRCCWAGCSRSAGRRASGPVLAAVLALASARGGILPAALLLGAYAAGLALPLIATAVAFDRTLGAAAFLRDRYAVIRVFSGIVLVILGLLVFFDRTWWLSVAVSRILRALGLDALTN